MVSNNLSVKIYWITYMQVKRSRQNYISTIEQKYTISILYTEWYIVPINIFADKQKVSPVLHK